MFLRGVRGSRLKGHDEPHELILDDGSEVTCMTCGKIGCCDSSPNKHATAHERESGHPIIRSAEPGEDWSWCYIDEVAFAFAPR